MPGGVEKIQRFGRAQMALRQCRRVPITVFTPEQWIQVFRFSFRQAGDDVPAVQILIRKIHVTDAPDDMFKLGTVSLEYPLIDVGQLDPMPPLIGVRDGKKISLTAVKTHVIVDFGNSVIIK